jgi:signal transduction histidine kinase
MPVVGRILPAITLGSGLILGVAGIAVERRAAAAVEAARRAEVAAVGRQARATAMALGVEAPPERAAALASEGLEATFPGAWRWLHLPPPGEGATPRDPTLAAVGERGLARLRAGETLHVDIDEGEERRAVVLTPLPAPEGAGPRLCLELSVSGRDLAALRAALRLEIGAAVIAATALVAALTLLLGRRLLSTPLREIGALLRAAGAGDPGFRIPAGRRGGEIEALAREANAMCDRVARFAAEAREQARATEEAQTHLRRAERLASIGKLAAGIAHELGTPLNVVAARARALQRAPAEAAEVERQAAIIVRQAERMTGIVRQLLDFSRRRAPHLAEVDVAEVARATAQLLEPQARAADISIVVEARPGLPRAVVDGAQLEQVLLNLLLNAIQASPGGGDVRVVADRASVRPPRDPDAPPPAREDPLAAPVEVIRVSVIDRGVGIPRDHMPQLFDPFFTTKSPGEGTGLGLPVAWGIVREHGGWFDLESVEGEGSRFTVHFPIHGPESRAPGAAPPGGRPASASASASGEEARA